MFIGPFYLLFVLFTVGPLVYAAYLSLFTHTLTGANLFVGLQNYRTLFGTSDFWSGLVGVVVLGVIQVPVMLAISVFLAVVLDMGLVRYGAVFRLLYFVPFAIPGAVAAIMWGYLLVPNLSPLDVIFAHLGLGTPNLLGGSFLWPALGNILTWELLGYNMLIIYTALQAVPRELTEAAVLTAGLAAMLVANGLLLRLGLAPLQRLTLAMTTTDLLRPGRRLTAGGRPRRPCASEPSPSQTPPT